MRMKNSDLIDLAIKSLIYEVSLYPKPGLVDPVDNGSHWDMNYYTFIDSSFALRKGFYNYLICGKEHEGTLKELFEKIRLVGLENEKSMYIATSNINTHKGSNFLFGIVISVIAYLDYPNLKNLRTGIKEMTSGLVYDELESLTEFHTHGEKVFRDYGIDGIRGEVERGLPSVFDIALPILNDEVDQGLGMKLALLKLIETNNDSNILKRGGMDGLEFVQSIAKQSYNDINQHLNNMNIEFKTRNLSPGGSADLLAISVFLKMYSMYIE